MIRIKGARQHNLQNLSLEIPQQRFVVITGPSGSGKSSLAFDTLFAEGQRRYVESLSTYARQFLDRLQKPDIDFIEGLSPAIAIKQQISLPNPRSTIATTTEIYDYLRLLFSSIGIAHDPNTGEVIRRQSPQQIVDEMLLWPAGTRVMLLAPLIRARGKALNEAVAHARREGFVRLRLDGKIVDLHQPEQVVFSKTKEHTIEVVVDRLMMGEGIAQRLFDSIETALKWGRNQLLALYQTPKENVAKESGGDHWETRQFSTDFCNPQTGFTMEPLAPKNFSFNNPLYACQLCHGLGSKISSTIVCEACHGSRLRPEILAVTLREKNKEQEREWNIHQFCSLTITEAYGVAERLMLSASERLIVSDVLREIKARLKFLEEVGLGYLTLHRHSGTLSGGETQRIRLATQIGSGLSGVLYVLDEPSIGLHQRDNERLLITLRGLRDLGNSVIVVEHDEETIMAADHVIDFGPGAGPLGGRIIAEGTPAQIMANPDSITGRYLSGDLKIPIPNERRKSSSSLKASTGWLRIIGARENNLKNLTVNFPVGLMTCVTGVSGSGKSTLVNDVLYCALAQKFYKAKEAPGLHDKILGSEQFDKIIVVDQSPIGRTPRSNPATYSGIFTLIRELFANLPAARVRAYKANRFSCNVKGGRCEQCQGDGMIRITMHFLPDVFVPCEVCNGRRFNRETLEITFKGKSIADLLESSVDEAKRFFSSVPAINEKLERLQEVGLGYLKLGQSGATLSGGEAQRLKLATELSKRSTGRTLYLLDEPTTGLHFTDIQKLLDVLFKLRNAGNSLIIIEHHLEVIKSADWVIDLGPEGGAAGGEIVVEGTPEQVAACKKSATGRYLVDVLKKMNL
ncbi:MAG: excinuclease ABC subunit UvrA [Chthoniobacterales bacterium]